MKLVTSDEIFEKLQPSPIARVKREIWREFCRSRLPAEPSERELQALVAAALTAAGMPFQAELTLSPRNRVDFLVDFGGIVIECKVGRLVSGTVVKQVRRYAKHPSVLGALLVTMRELFVYPSEIEGKPFSVLALNATRGIAV